MNHQGTRTKNKTEKFLGHAQRESCFVALKSDVKGGREKMLLVFRCNAVTSLYAIYFVIPLSHTLALFLRGVTRAMSSLFVGRKCGLLHKIQQTEDLQINGSVRTLV